MTDIVAPADPAAVVGHTGARQSSARKLSVATKVYYGIGQIGEGLKSRAFGTFLFFYYAQVLGLSGTLAGVASFISLCFDAVTDPIAGSLSDDWRSKWGRRHPFMYASAIPLGIAIYFLFVPPDGLDQIGLFIWLTAFAIIGRGAMTLYHVPHLALGAELSTDYVERTAIVSYRVFFGVVTAIVGTVLAFNVFFAPTPDYPNGQLNPSAYPAFAFTFGLGAAVTILISALGTHNQIPFLPKPGDGVARFGLMRVVRETVAAAKTPSFRWLFAAHLIGLVGVGAANTLELHMLTYFWELETGTISILLIAAGISALFGIPITRVLHRYFDKRATKIGGILWYSFFHILPIVLRLVGWFPENGSPFLLPALVVFIFVATMGGMAIIVSANSMMADVVDENELITGRRQEGIFFAATSFSGKASSGLGIVVAGIAIDLLGFPAQADPSAVPYETVRNLGLFVGPGLFFFLGAAVYFNMRYPLTRARHAEIRAKLDAGAAPAE